MPELSPDDVALVETARETMRRRHDERFHHVAAAMRTTGGQVFSGINLEVTVGRIAVCAETVATGIAASGGGMGGGRHIDVIVAGPVRARRWPGANAPGGELGQPGRSPLRHVSRARERLLARGQGDRADGGGAGGRARRRVPALGIQGSSGAPAAPVP